MSGLLLRSLGLLLRSLGLLLLASAVGMALRLHRRVIRIDRHFELALRNGNRRALGLRMQQLEMGDPAARIKALTLPTLVLWGSRDRVVPPANAQRFAADIRGAKLVVFEDLGHVPHDEDPARTIAAVVEFLEMSR